MRLFCAIFAPRGLLGADKFALIGHMDAAFKSDHQWTNLLGLVTKGSAPLKHGISSLLVLGREGPSGCWE